MQRVITYIDGFNLYFGLRSKQWKKYYWLDLQKLSQHLLNNDQKLIHCHYFTARIRANEADKEDALRQSSYLDALQCSTDLTLHYGHFLRKRRKCPHCGQK